MRKEYDFANAKPNPYIENLRQQASMRIDIDTVDQRNAAETGAAGGGTCISRTQPTYPEELTPEERNRLLAESKNYEDFMDKAIAFGKITGDFTIDRHIWPQRSSAEIAADIIRLQNEHPEQCTAKQARWAGN